MKPSILHGLYRRYISRTVRSEVTPALVSHRPSVFSAIVDSALARPQPHLVLTLRTGAAVSPSYARRIERNLAGLIDHPEAERFTWVTPVEALALLTSRGPSPETSNAGR